MSRVGRKPVPIPEGVRVEIRDHTVTVQGPRGELSRQIHRDMVVAIENGQVLVKRPSDDREHRALHGLTRSLIANLIEGVTRGYARTLELVGTGYRASKSGGKLVITVGYSHPVEVEPPPGIDIEVPNPTTVVVRGADKEAVGQWAANIRSIRRPEPYLGKGIRYAGEKVRRKVGKAGKAGKAGKK